MLLACLGDAVATVTLGNHHERSTVCLELIYVWIHTVGCCRAHRSARISLGSLGRSCIEDGVILEVVGHSLTGIQASLEFGMCNVASHDDSSLQVDTGAHRILRQFGANSINTLVEVDLYTLRSFTRIAHLSRDELCGVVVHLLKPYTVLVDLCLDVAVGRAAHTHTDGAAGTMARQTDDTDVVGEILTTKLCSKSNLVSLFEQLLLKVDVAEGTTCLIACGGQ